MIKYLFVSLLFIYSISFSQMILSKSASGTYFQDENGVPILLNGSSAWDLFARVNYTDAKLYMDSLSARGVNLVNARFISGEYTGGTPNIYGVEPWLVTQAFGSSINEQYWAHVDSIMDYLLVKGIYVWAFVGYLGHTDNEGLHAEVAAATVAEMKAYGQFIAQRYDSYPNLIWAIGGDRDPTDVQSKLDSLIAGIKQYSTKIIGPRDDLENADKRWASHSYNSWITMNYVYAQNEREADWIKQARSRKPTLIPFIFSEGNYENEAPKGHTTTDIEARSLMYWAITYGACGQIFGSCPEWNFDNFSGYAACNGLSWKTNFNSALHQSQRWFGKLFRNRRWWTLIPDTSHAVLTAGWGDIYDVDIVTCGYASDGSSIIVYDPRSTQITVNSSVLNGSDSVYAWWYNPADGTSSFIGAQTQGSNNYTAAAADRVLVLDAKSMGFPAPGLDTVAVSNRRRFIMNN